MAIALVKSAKGLSTTAITAPAFGSATASGNLIVIAMSTDAYNATPDTGWTESTGMEQLANHGAYIWWRISAGETAYQYTIGSVTTSSWVIMEFSGCDAAPYDISAGQFLNSGTTSYTTPTITPTTGNRLLVGRIGGSSNAASLAGALTTWLNSFTAIDSNGQAAGNATCVGTAYRLVTGNGATTFDTGATYPISPTSRSGQIIAFKEATVAASATGLVGSGGGGAYFAQDSDDDRGTQASRKRRRKFLEDRARRIREL